MGIPEEKLGQPAVDRATLKARLREAMEKIPVDGSGSPEEQEAIDEIP